ncbi:MAG TPA: galactokinase [Pyrinomonadaceae bacterium]|nr:galactokinase [Pyrinomonadaceae bacterium]
MNSRHSVNMVREVSNAFENLYGEQPRIYRAPGRVNLIGEHTDYNEGFVMPAAIDFSTYVAMATRDDRKIKIHSDLFNEDASLDLAHVPPPGGKHWSRYPFGVAVKLQEAGHCISGANVFVHGEVPLGSGLSSSAAIEVSTGLGLLDISQERIDRMQLAKICQKAENTFVGAHTGLMDQFIACFGKAGHAVMLDCRSLESQALPIPQEVKLVVCNTMVKHELASSEYNKRREQCEEGVRILSKHLDKVKSLRDVTVDDLKKFEMPEVIYRRCLHVTSENDRVRAAADALRRRDLQTFGKLMYKSHESLRDNYEVSCEELDVMVGLAREVEGVYGARMTGGGFGGCTINLVVTEAVDRFKRAIKTGYSEKTKRDPEIYICEAADGAERIQ